MNKIFLATTSIDYFWDKNATSGVFLGEWCKKNNKKDLCNGLKWKTLSYSLSDKKNKQKAILFCDYIYREIFEKLYKILNTFHNVENEPRYWDILLSPWLYSYIQIFYDRYLHILEVSDKYKDIYTFTLSEQYFVEIRTPQEFYQKSSYNDLYNLQLYSQIIDFLEIKHTKLHPKINFFLPQKKNSITKVLRKIFNSVLSNASLLLNTVFNKNSVLVVSPYFKYKKVSKTIKLMVKSKFLFVFNNFDYKLGISGDMNMDARRDIFQIKVENNFINLVFKSFIYNFPIIYLEEYNNFNKNVLGLNIKRPDIIYSANALYNNEIFKFYIARYYHDIVITYAQHGGNYGIDKELPEEKVERNFADIYFTFGWGNDGIKTRILQQSILKKEYLKKEQILLVMTIAPKYTCRFMYTINAADMTIYINNSRIFLLSFSFSFKDKLVIRTRNDNFWYVQESLSRDIDNLNFNNSINFYKQISQSRIVVFDHMSTGYLETLSANIPTVIFILDTIYDFRDDAKEYIDELIRVKILFKNAVDASVFIQENYKTINKWWYSKEVQEVRLKFCNKYMQVSSEWEKQWIVEFNKILEKECKNKVLIKDI